MIKKIVVAYDQSKPAKKSLKYTIDLVKTMKGNPQIILLYVLKIGNFRESFYHRLIPSPKTGETITLEEYLKDAALELRTDVKKMLENKIKKIIPKGFSMDSVVLFGDPAEEILRFSESKKIDLIIMGNVGLKGLSKIKTLGSVSRNVTENSKCPVLITHQ